MILGSLYPFQPASTFVTNNSINSSEIGIIHLQNCIPSSNPTYTFDLKCLAPLIFTTTNNTMNTTLYNCPLDCFFDWNTTKINEKQSINVSRCLSGSSVSYYLMSALFPNSQVVCGAVNDCPQTSTFSSTIMTTFEQTTVTQSTTKSHNPTISETPVIGQDMDTTSSSDLSTAFPESTTSKFISPLRVLGTSQSSVPELDETTVYSSPLKNLLAQTTISNNPSTSQSFTNLVTKTSEPGVWQPPSCSNGKIGLNCSVSNNVCLLTEPCQNNGTCKTTNSSFICLCPPSRFTGKYCEIDIRPCQPYTCLNHGTCNEINSTSFICLCEPGY
jgi:hypothetical protein